MVSSGRQVIAFILLILALAVCVRPQQTSEKVPTGSISGTITLKGKGVAGIVVDANNPGNWKKRYRATTDDLGNYSLTKLPRGKYELTVVTGPLIVEDGLPTRSLLVAEGETVENINFALSRGGVVTGKVTTADGQPLIEESISLVSVDPGIHQWIRTDDRGIYRFFGVRPGKYIVHAGKSKDSAPGDAGPFYRTTYHPSVTDPAKATIIEVTAESESNDVDITIASAATTFRVSGRIVDGETGKPMPNIQYGLTHMTGEGSSSRHGGLFSNAAGEFKIENALPGKYFIFLVSNSDVRGEPLNFEVVDRDLTDLLIKTSKGASISGVVVFESSDEKVNPKQLEMLLHVWILRPGQLNESRGRRQFNEGKGPVQVNADGSFQIGGLSGGVAHLSIFAMRGISDLSRLEIVRIERNGASQSPSLELKDDENISGLRLIVKEFSGAIRGVVKMENGEPLPMRVQVWLSRVDENSPNSGASGLSSNELDSRGRFFIKGLRPGTYEVSASDTPPFGRSEPAKQRVTVTNNTVTEVDLTLPAKSNPNQRPQF